MFFLKLFKIINLLSFNGLKILLIHNKKFNLVELILINDKTKVVKNYIFSLNIFFLSKRFSYLIYSLKWLVKLIMNGILSSRLCVLYAYKFVYHLVLHNRQRLLDRNTWERRINHDFLRLFYHSL